MPYVYTNVQRSEFGRLGDVVDRVLAGRCGSKPSTVTRSFGGVPGCRLIEGHT